MSNCRVNIDDDPRKDPDPGSDDEREEPEEGVYTNRHAIFAQTLDFDGALVHGLEQKLPQSTKHPPSQNSGYVYILKSTCIPNMLKISVTTTDPIT